MNVKTILRFLDDFEMLVLFEKLLYNEKREIEEWGNPTSSKYDEIVELLNLVSELS